MAVTFGRITLFLPIYVDTYFLATFALCSQLVPSSSLVESRLSRWANTCLETKSWRPEEENRKRRRIVHSHLGSWFRAILRKFNIGSLVRNEDWRRRTSQRQQQQDNQSNKPRLNIKVREVHILTSRLKLSTKQLSIKQPATQQQRRQRTSVICRRESQSPSNPVSPGPSSSFADVLNAVRTLSSNSRSMWSLERQPRMLHFNVTQVIARTKNGDDRGGIRFPFALLLCWPSRLFVI